MLKRIVLATAITCFLFSKETHAQKFDLSRLYLQQKLEVVNRKASISIENKKQFVHLSEEEGEGLLWLPIKNFSNGEIVIMMRGKDVPQRSFIGIAFHGKNNETYDAVYCRPFNFHAQDSVRRIHAIQYISHPTFTWKKLREEQNAQFEKEIPNAPDPNGWFTLKLVIDEDLILAYINNNKTEVLKVRKLQENYTGKIGIFMGDGSGGDFEYIKIKNN